jgi:hypothetical protein
MSIRLERDEAPSAAHADAAMRRFVEDLDQAMMRIELQGLLTPRVEHPPALGKVLWRAAAPGMDRATHVIALVEPDGFGLLVKLGGRYSWHAGSSDLVLATVPDEMMESAVACVLGGPK